MEQQLARHPRDFWQDAAAAARILLYSSDFPPLPSTQRPSISAYIHLRVLGAGRFLHARDWAGFSFFGV